MSTISPLKILSIAEKIVAEYVDRGFTTFDLGDRQFYHAVSSDEMFNINDEPSQLGVGDLDDDIAELMKIDNGEMPSAVDIERLGRVLIAISEAVID